MSAARVPVTVLTGFLGSGKTTLLNRLLSAPDAAPTAVLVNEFGEVGIDGSLVVGATEELVELENGCVCCTVRGDLTRTLTELMERRERGLFRRARFERVVIETSGLASPGPVGQTLAIDARLSAAYALDGICTLANAAHLVHQLAEHPEVSEQLGYADRILLNHADRCDERALAAAEDAARGCNGLAPIARASHGDVDLDFVLAICGRSEGWDLERAGSAAHGSGLSTVSLGCDEPLDFHKLKLWLQFVASRRGPDLMRVKGTFACKDRSETVVVQGMYDWLELSPGAEPRPARSRVVFIGRSLDPAELERGFNACRGGTTMDA